MECILEKRLGSWRPIDDNGYAVNAKLPDGTRAVVDIKDPRRRSGQQHKYWFALVGILFDSQEYYADFDDFRRVLLIRLGRCKVYETKDGPIPVAESVAFGKMDEAEFTKLVDATLDFAEEMGFERAALQAEAKARV